MKRKLSLIVSLGCVAALLAGCGNKENPGVNGPIIESGPSTNEHIDYAQVESDQIREQLELDENGNPKAVYITQEGSKMSADNIQKVNETPAAVRATG